MIVKKNAKIAIFVMKVPIIMKPCPFVNIARMAKRIVLHNAKKEKLLVLIVKILANQKGDE